MLKKLLFLLSLFSLTLFAQENTYLQNNGEEVNVPQDKVVIIQKDKEERDDTPLNSYIL